MGSLSKKKNNGMEAASNGVQAAPGGAEQQAQGLPLFFKQPAVLDVGRHGKATVTPITDYGFTRETNSVPLNAIEFIEAAKFYPIVFTVDETPMPVAVLGLEKGNYFVEATGKWKADSYIPAYVRQYPFIFFEQPEQKQFFLCIDEASDAFHADAVEGGAPIYTDGKASELSNNALQFCTAYYQHHAITKNLCADLVQHKLLGPFQSEATLASGKKLHLSGFQMIDENAFNALPDEVFLEFRKKGWLAFIYLAMSAASNWKRLMDLAGAAA